MIDTPEAAANLEEFLRTGKPIERGNIRYRIIRAGTPEMKELSAGMTESETIDSHELVPHHQKKGLRRVTDNRTGSLNHMIAFVRGA